MSETERDSREQNDGAENHAIRPEHVLSVRLGHGANCSSVGSVIDTLFVGAAVGGAIFAAICAAMREEPVRVVEVAPDAADSADSADSGDDAVHDDAKERAT